MKSNRPEHPARMTQARHEGERGFVMILAVVAAVVLFGMLGLSFDLGRMYITRNEFQAYVDSAALAAVLELDGTASGVTQSASTAKNFPNQWTFGTDAVPTPTVTFSTQQETGYVDEATAAGNPTGISFVRVRADSQIPMFFIPVFDGLGGADDAPRFQSTNIPAQAAAGQLPLTSFDSDAFPYSPDALIDGAGVPLNPNAELPYGFVKYQSYTIRWAPYQAAGSNVPPNLAWPPVGMPRCPGETEVNYWPNNFNGDRGYIDIGTDSQNSGNASFIREAIVNGVQSRSIEVGDPLIEVRGVLATETAAIIQRVSQDTDLWSSDYRGPDGLPDTGDEYDGNGRRIVNVPINDPNNVPSTVIGFAAFLLPIEGEICTSNNANGAGGPSGVCCAQYIGDAIKGGGEGAGDTGFYRAVLVQ